MLRKSHDAGNPQLHDVTLSSTIQQVSDQLGMVSQLKEQNHHYLTELEKGWIGSIISNAKTAIEDLEISTGPMMERHEQRLDFSNGLVDSQQSKRVVQLSTMTTYSLTQLMAVAQKLNSATSLLSCCYDRYEWSTHYNKGMSSIAEGPDSDLAQLLDRRRNRKQSQNPLFVHHDPISFNDSQVSNSISNGSEERFGSIRSPTESVTSNGSHENFESDGLLSLMVMESIDRWVKAAETALEKAMQQSSSMKSSDLLTKSHLPVRPASRTNTHNQTDASSVSLSSTPSNRSSNIYVGTSMSPRTARLVYLPKTSPRTHSQENAGLNIYKSPPSSPTPAGSDTTICAVDTTGPMAQRRVSRGRAWLERQIEAGIA